MISQNFILFKKFNLLFFGYMISLIFSVNAQKQKPEFDTDNLSPDGYIPFTIKGYRLHSTIFSQGEVYPKEAVMTRESLNPGPTHVPSAIAQSENTIYLSDLSEISVEGLFHDHLPEIIKDVWPDGKSLDIDGQTYEKGLQLLPKHNSECIITYDLDGKYNEFQTWVGHRSMSKTWFEWSRIDADGRFMGLKRPEDGFRGKETDELVRTSAAASFFVRIDGEQKGDTVFFNCRMEPIHFSCSVAGGKRLEIVISAWGIESCNTPYHDNDTYPGCPKKIGVAYNDWVTLGNAKLL